MVRGVPPVVLGALAVALGACGSGDGGSTTTTAAPTATTTQATAPAPAGRYTAAEVAKKARFTKAPDGRGWISLTGCRVTRIMTTNAEVLRYRTSPDAFVVTNPADDVGVVFVPGPQCREALTANLTLVK